MAERSRKKRGPRSNVHNVISQIVLLIVQQEHEEGESKFTSLTRRSEFQKQKQFCQDLQNGPLKFLKRFSNVFHLQQLSNKDYVISLSTKLELCEHHTSHHGCSLRQCESLHACVFYLLGADCRFGGNCSYGHDLRSNHNKDLLYQHNLELLNDQQLQAVFRKNRCKQTLPQICRFYNVGDGCKKDGGKCQNLHICSHYMDDDCSFGHRCKRSHNIYDTQPKQLLQKFQIQIDRSPKETLNELRTVYGNEGRRQRTTSGHSTGRESDDFDDDDIEVASVTSTESANDDKIDEICTFYLRGSCSYNKFCKKYHGDQPYQWQYNKGSGWIDFGDKDNKSSEESYCTINKDGVYVEIDGLVHKAVFDAMKLELGLTKYHMRRLSTPSAALTPSTHLFNTKWLWYWKDGQTTEYHHFGVNMNKWRQYGEKDGLGNQAEITSDDLEHEFLKGLHQTTFKTIGFKYIILFDEMKQRNETVGTERTILRRPVFVTQQDVADMKKGKRLQKLSLSESHIRDTLSPRAAAAHDMTSTHGNASVSDDQYADIPPHWNMNAMSDNQFFQLVKISPDNAKERAEYDHISALFHQTLPSTSFQINSIHRIQNLDLWEDYARLKKRMDKRQTTGDLTTEKHLFHGTRSKYIDAICEQGFDWRVSGSSTGTLFGKGSYFAKEAKYSDSYNRDCKKIFVVKVLVGSYTTGNSSMVRPPPKDPTKPLENFYDSCVNSETNPTIFVVFDKAQAYPEYLIDYN